jgi:hypothetical protein
MRVTFALAFISVALVAPRVLWGDQPSSDNRPRHRFADFGFMPLATEYEGRVFELRQDYPSKLPPEDAVPDFCKRDFDGIRKDWKRFLLDVRSYCFKGNVLGGDQEDDWRLEGAGNHWYHMPWQHYGPNGREGIHGLTKEAPVQPRQLAWTQTQTGGQTYAVAFYNEFGGYTIWQVWQDSDKPISKGVPIVAGRRKISFPVGTVICKLLFTDVRTDQVPFLNPPLQWQAYITQDFASTQRSIRSVSLIQMDIMVRHRSAPSGWLFGTYQYNGKLGRATRWENLAPVGLQWGNDPDITENTANPQPVQTQINSKLRETVVNSNLQELPPTHLGWNGRLNGPVDNPMSSCMSCHMTAEYPQRSEISPLFEKNPPEPGSKQWMRWFANTACSERFDEHSLATDFSLQLAISLQNYYAWRNQDWKLRAKDYMASKVPSRIKRIPSQIEHPKPNNDEKEREVDIRRDYPPR